MIDKKILEAAITVLRAGGVIAYPTEAVFGLGCDPQNEQAIQKILQLKKRESTKGLILIAANWQQLQNYVAEIPAAQLERVFATWPGPNTWIFPAKETVSTLLLGPNHTIAVRVTAHPIAKQLCLDFGLALVSTSANLAAGEPARSVEAVQQYFGNALDYIVNGELGGQVQPTNIRDALTNKLIRGEIK